VKLWLDVVESTSNARGVDYFSYRMCAPLECQPALKKLIYIENCNLVRPTLCACVCVYVLVERICCIVHESMVESWTSMVMVS